MKKTLVSNRGRALMVSTLTGSCTNISWVKKTLVSIEAENGEWTDWVMHEYIGTQDNASDESSNLSNCISYLSSSQLL